MAMPIRQKQKPMIGTMRRDKDMAFYEQMSPTLLATMDSEPAHDEKKLNKEEELKWQELQGHLEARRSMLYSWRSSWWMLNYSSLAAYLDPQRSIWLTQSAGGLPTPNNMIRGQQINNAIVDPTGMYAKRICVAGLMSGLASPSRPWFTIKSAINGAVVDDAGLDWMDQIKDAMYTVMANSNFYTSFATEINDAVVYGTAPVITYEDEQDIIRCYNPCVGEYYLGSDAANRTNALYRTFVQTIAQIVSMFGIDNCPPNVQLLWKEKGSALDKELIVAHSIEPNFEINESGAGKIPGNYTWREVYWLYGQKAMKPLSMRGFIECPFTVSLWSQNSNDPYGRSVGMDVLPDIVQLQFETRRKAEAIEKHVRPPMLGSIELKNNPSAMLPDQVTYVSDITREGMKPIYQVMPDMSGMMEDLAAIQQRIMKGFFVDLFLMIDAAPSKNMTATQVQAMVTEKMMVLGPVVENILNVLRQRCQRVFSIMQRRGMFPPPPPSMKGVPIKIEFTSLLAVAQKGAATAGVERILQMVGNMSAVFPQSVDLINVDVIVREYNDMLANPHNILNGEKEVQAVRQQKQMAQQKAQQMQEQAVQAKVGNVNAQSAQVLAGTTLGGGKSALDAMLGQQA